MAVREEQLTEEQKAFMNKSIMIKYSDVINYDPLKAFRPENIEMWNANSPQTQEYKDMMEELTVLVRYIAMRISTGPEVKDNTLKRCATYSTLLNELVINVAVDGWHTYGVLMELSNNVYMSMSGKMKTIELLRSITIANQMKSAQTMKEKMGSSVV